ncbi:MAG: hypothetical protein K0Q52_10 [Microbacterium sp.]|nr:hypothetical protein [Microbacterium sp.]
MHDGQALAADEPDRSHHRVPGVASVHTRALVTWISIFPLVTTGMAILALFADGWPPILRALVLTLVVVPLAVYVLVPNLLRLELALRARVMRSRPRRTADSSSNEQAP